MTTEQDLYNRAKEMRRTPTEWEKRLWRHLSGSQLGGFKFRRQAVIPPYICDFLCPAKALIIEIDGDTHVSDRDKARDTFLRKKGYRVSHFTNAEVAGNLNGVLTAILDILQSTPDRWPARPHPNPAKAQRSLAGGKADAFAPEGEGLRINSC